MKSLLSVTMPPENTIYTIYDPVGIKLLHRLQLDFSHLCECKFRHNFGNTVNSCFLEIRSTEHYFLSFILLSTQPLWVT